MNTVKMSPHLLLLVGAAKKKSIELSVAALSKRYPAVLPGSSKIPPPDFLGLITKPMRISNYKVNVESLSSPSLLSESVVKTRRFPQPYMLMNCRIRSMLALH